MRRHETSTCAGARLALVVTDGDPVQSLDLHFGHGVGHLVGTIAGEPDAAFSSSCHRIPARRGNFWIPTVLPSASRIAPDVHS